MMGLGLLEKPLKTHLWFKQKIQEQTNQIKVMHETKNRQKGENIQALYLSRRDLNFPCLFFGGFCGGFREGRL